MAIRPSLLVDGGCMATRHAAFIAAFSFYEGTPTRVYPVHPSSVAMSA